MKKIWDFINDGYIHVHTDDTTGKISIKWLILIIGAIIVYNYYLI
jgi:hypothetical protein